jgi:hypothetical protein
MNLKKIIIAVIVSFASVSAFCQWLPGPANAIAGFFTTLSVTGTATFADHGTWSSSGISTGSNITGATITGTGNITNAATPGRTIQSAFKFIAGNATSSQGGELTVINDAGTNAWLIGLLGSAGATDFSIFDLPNSASRVTINHTTGLVTLSNGLAVTTTTTSTGHSSPSTGNTPTIASAACGALTNGTISGTDQDGKITIGAATTTACAVTFGSSTWASGPNSCTFSPASAASAALTVLPYISALSASGFTLSGSVLGSTSFYYHCQ